MSRFAVLSRIVAAAAMPLLGGASVAQPALSTVCDLMPDASEYCVPVVACVDDARAVHFVGRALGRTGGLVDGSTSEGVLCEGTWTAKSDFGFGQAEFACSDGRSGRASFTYLDPRTGTAFGSGIMQDGTQLRMWSGNAIGQFKGADGGTLDAEMMCGGAPIPIS
jgi:hypothetical protein